MQLRKARLCLDCEELHDQIRCPVCASESFAFLTQWLPVDERRRRPRFPAAGRNTARARSMPKRWAAGTAAGLGLVALGRWFWRD